MKVQALALIAICFGLALFSWAQDKNVPGADQAKVDANDVKSINHFVGSQLNAAFRKSRQDPKQALKMMDDLSATLEGLKPTDPQAKMLVMQAEAAIKRYRVQIQAEAMSMDEVRAMLKKQPTDPTAIELYGSKVLMKAGPLASDEPERAEKTLNEGKKYLTDLREKVKDNEDATKAIDRAEKQFGQIERMIASAKKLKELIGKDATSLTADAWVNGAPLTDEELKGKVVLLDFWAVWCGPCVSTFPHLREWQEKYADKGLVMIGVTGYYNFVWDAEGERAKPSNDKVTEAQEQDMLKQFAAHNKLTHRIAVDKEGKMADFYGVTGIPHVVLIDRHGKIRLIKVGASPDTAKEIEAMLEKLIGEKA